MLKANPTLRLVDIEGVAKLVHSVNPDIILVVDNTFMSPYFQNPLQLGADIVVHSVTKYINGHSDCVMGFAATSNEKLYTKLKFLQNSIGAVPSAFDCFLSNRGLKTLHLRMQQHGKNGMAIATHLSKSKYVDSVIYPGLESHPSHELAKKQQSGFGGMVSFRIKGDLNTANKFLNNLQLFTLAESLGGVESLANHPALMTHASIPEDKRKEIGITDDLVRLSTGVEDIDDLLADLEQAFR
jgi:cystathionine gamma-lyase